MFVVAIDLELNQPSNRIIQIGAAVACTQSKQIVDRGVWWLDPGESINLDSELKSRGPNCQTLADLLGEEFLASHKELARPSKGELESFWSWLLNGGSGRKLIQWGAGDLHLLIEESKALGVPYPNRIKCLDLKLAYHFLFQYQKALGLEKALALQGLEFQGRPHDGLVDAENTAYLYLEMADKIKKLKQIEGIINA